MLFFENVLYSEVFIKIKKDIRILCDSTYIKYVPLWDNESVAIPLNEAKTTIPGLDLAAFH